MNNSYISVSAGECIGELSAADSTRAGMLAELAEVCAASGINAVSVTENNGRRYVMAGTFCGFVRFTDGTLLELLPDTGGDTESARISLYHELCRRCGATPRTPHDSAANFMELFIALFAAETMKVIKSGVLSTYTSREENLTTVQGTILFPENIRRNLVHRERLYVRHDIFTSDRAENRLIKAAAKKLIALTDSPRSSHLLREALSYLDEAASPHDISAEFSKCINTRNTKKYSTVLSICRMLFDTDAGVSVSGRYISCALLFRLTQQE